MMPAPAVVAVRRGGPGRPIVSAFPTTRGTRSRPTTVRSYSRSWTRTSRPASSDAAPPAARTCRPAKLASGLAEHEHGRRHSAWS